jgi:hypothetical protein
VSIGGFDVRDTEEATRSGRKRKEKAVLNVLNRDYLLKQFAKIRPDTRQRQPRRVQEGSGL